jgi:chromosome segregation ATPase
MRGEITEAQITELMAAIPRAEEVDRLRAEVERLRADLAIQQGCCDGAAAQDAHVRQEREEHRAEVERLREALGWMLALHDDLQPSYDKASTIAAARRVHGGER